MHKKGVAPPLLTNCHYDIPLFFFNCFFIINNNHTPHAHTLMISIWPTNELIGDDKLSADLDAIVAHMLDIFEVASASSSLQSQIRKFNNIYLPTVLKLLNRYIELDSRRVQSKAVTDAKTAIAVSVDDAKHAFAKLNEELLSQTSVDTEAEIDAFKSLLAIDGLSGKNEMVMPKVDEQNT